MTPRSIASGELDGEPADDEAALLDRIDRRLAAGRADAGTRRVGFGATLLVGLVLATVHWLGLVAAGALVGLTRQRLRGAVASGLLVGLLAVGVTPVVAPTLEPAEFVALAPLNYATALAGVLLPVWGSLVRYVV